MKKSIFLAAVAFMLMSVSASAQFMQSNGGSKAKASVEDVFNTVDLTYSPITEKTTIGDRSSTTDYNGISLNWSQARLMTDKLPIYLQYGAGAQFSWYTDSSSNDYYNVKTTTSFLTVKVPVNVLYNFAIPNTNLSVMPYLGLNAQVHVLGQQKTTTEEYDGDKDTFKVNYFSKDDMEESPYKKPFNRFVLGWQIGAMVSYDKYFVGIGYNGPVTSLFKDGDYKIQASQVNISLGIMF